MNGRKKNAKVEPSNKGKVVSREMRVGGDGRDEDAERHAISGAMKNWRKAMEE